MRAFDFSHLIVTRIELFYELHRYSEVETEVTACARRHERSTAKTNRKLSSLFRERGQEIVVNFNTIGK